MINLKCCKDYGNQQRLDTILKKGKYVNENLFKNLWSILSGRRNAFTLEKMSSKITNIWTKIVSLLLTLRRFHTSF